MIPTESIINKSQLIHNKYNFNTVFSKCSSISIVNIGCNNFSISRVYENEKDQILNTFSMLIATHNFQKRITA